VVTALAALAGLVVLAGLTLAVSGLRKTVPTVRPPRMQPARWHSWQLPSPERMAIIAAAGLVTLVLVRWPVAVACVVVGVEYLTRPGDGRADDAAKADALTAWVEMLRDATGTPRGIEGVLTATADGAPVLIRPHVVRLARRLAYEPLDEALDDLADDLAHPVGDLVVTSLRLAARSGGRQIRSVLDDLAASAREEARMHRRIEVARERPRSDMRSVITVMTLFVGLLIFAARDYLEPYDTVVGQIVLAVVVLSWAGGVAVMVRMGRSKPVERFLVRRADVAKVDA
jgi:Flp pilus assembly protein TadB